MHEDFGCRTQRVPPSELHLSHLNDTASTVDTQSFTSGHPVKELVGIELSENLHRQSQLHSAFWIVMLDADRRDAGLQPTL